jgi:hypothetical protein
LKANLRRLIQWKSVAGGNPPRWSHFNQEEPNSKLLPNLGVGLLLSGSTFTENSEMSSECQETLLNTLLDEVLRQNPLLRCLLHCKRDIVVDLPKKLLNGLHKLLLHVVGNTKIMHHLHFHSHLNNFLHWQLRHIRTLIQLNFHIFYPFLLEWIFFLSVWRVIFGIVS